MKRQFKLLAVTTLAVSMTSLSAVAADTCGGRGRANYGQRLSYARPPVYRSAYQQPVYRSGAIAHPVASAPVNLQRQRQRVAPVPVASALVAPASVGPAPVGPAPVAQRQPIQGGPMQTQAQPNPNLSQTVQPTGGQLSVTEATTQQPDGKPATTEATALQLLESITDDTVSTDENDHGDHEHTVATSTVTGDHVGTWKVALPGDQSVELNLTDNGTFNWTATNKGKTNSFDGQFRMEMGRLTLVRSSDLQQMAGSWTANGDKFTFKLDGTTTGGLAFARN